MGIRHGSHKMRPCGTCANPQLVLGMQDRSRHGGGKIIAWVSVVQTRPFWSFFDLFCIFWRNARQKNIEKQSKNFGKTFKSQLRNILNTCKTAVPRAAEPAWRHKVRWITLGQSMPIKCGWSFLNQFGLAKRHQNSPQFNRPASKNTNFDNFEFLMFLSFT